MSGQVVRLHGESLRAGIRLAAVVYTGTPTVPDDLVRRIQGTIAERYAIDEFPLSALTNAHRERQERRRAYAMRAMEVLLAQLHMKAGYGQEGTLPSKDQIDEIASKAWQMAAAMEAQEQVSATLDSLSSPDGG